MNSFKLFESHREIKFYICGCICVMCQIYMVMKTIVFLSKSKCFVPFFSFCFPVFVPFQLFSWTNEILHFHLLKFPHSKNELSCNDFISKCFSDLCNSERNS